MNKRLIIKNLTTKNQKYILNQNSNFDIKFVSGFLSINNSKISNYDFIDCDFSYSKHNTNIFSDCFFSKAIMKNTSFIACTFDNIIFNECKFIGTSFIASGQSISIVTNTIFERCEFSNLNIDYILFKNCTFNECKILTTDFNGASFEDVSFKGIISDSFFRGRIKHLPIYTFWDNITGKKIDPYLFKNNMKNIDFSECVLDGVSFCDDIKLNECVFPKSERYLYIRDVAKVYTDSYNYIMNNWSGENLRLAKIVFETVLMSKFKGDQVHDFVDFDLIQSYTNIEFVSDLKDVLRRHI